MSDDKRNLSALPREESYDEKHERWARILKAEEDKRRPSPLSVCAKVYDKRTGEFLGYA